jgi:hypothetical protein
MDQSYPSKSSTGAIQMLVWVIEEIAKTGNKEAEHHARLALQCLMSANQQPKNF